MNHKKFIPFVMAGYPNLVATEEIILELSRIGADMIELGVPFSDPIADGTVNIIAADHAVKQGVNLKQCLSLVKNLREKNMTTPIVIFSYFNPILKMGVENFAKSAVNQGVDAVLVVDLPWEEFSHFYSICHSFGLKTILLASPTTSDQRLKHYCQYDLAFVYYISRRGVTGEQSTTSASLAEEIQHLRSLIPFPLYVGFGISTPEQARKVAMMADGVIVGSALVKYSNEPEKLIALASEMKRAICEISLTEPM